MRHQSTLYGDESSGSDTNVRVVKTDVVDDASRRSSSAVTNTDDSGVISIRPFSAKRDWNKIYKGSVIPPAKRFPGTSTGSSPISDNDSSKMLRVRSFDTLLSSPDGMSPESAKHLEDLIAQLAAAQEEKNSLASDKERLQLELEHQSMAQQKQSNLVNRLQVICNSMTSSHRLFSNIIFR